MEALKKARPDFARMRSLVMSFRGILQSGKTATLARWMKKAVGSGIYGMKRFVRKLNHDLAAVKNALRESWSNGPVEGHINRLKTLKRQMYGRAGFELLRARLLPMSRGSTLHRSEEESNKGETTCRLRPSCRCGLCCRRRIEIQRPQ